MGSGFDNQKLIPVLFIGAAAVFLYLGLQPTKSKLSKEAMDVKVQRTVNDHLRKTAEEIELQKRQMSIRNWQLANDYRKSIGEKAYTVPKEGAELQEEKFANDVARDLGRDGSLSKISQNPMDMIHHQLFEAQAMRQHDEAYRKEYARQFVENARRGGWEVKLSDDYRVLSTKRIRSPSGN